MIKNRFPSKEIARKLTSMKFDEAPIFDGIDPIDLAKNIAEKVSEHDIYAASILKTLNAFVFFSMYVKSNFKLNSLLKT